MDPAAPESGRTPVALSVFLQKVGRGETGVLTLTTYAEVDAFLVHDDESPGEPEPAVVATPTETVTWTYTERVDTHWDSVTHVLDATLAQALVRFTNALG